MALIVFEKSSLTLLVQPGQTKQFSYDPVMILKGQWSTASPWEDLKQCDSLHIWEAMCHINKGMGKCLGIV